jgi:hypothetical protein
MKMKYNIIKFGLIFFATFFLFNSCNDEFLERYPQDEITSKTFWNTESDLKTYNNSIYDLSARYGGDQTINIGHGNGAWDSHNKSRWFMDVFTDNFATTEPRMSGYNRVRTGQHQVSSGSRQYGYAGWDLVREINVGLENYYKAELSMDVINKYAGEARFFRAWFYADKVQKFGDVPWVGKPLNVDSEKLFAARMPREQAMDSVLADINFAVEHLPEQWAGAPNDGTGRFNKWHALLIKSRICLFEGTWRKYHGGSNPEMWLQEAADAAKEVIDNSPYEIYSTGDPQNDYNSFHQVLDLSGNPEVMYWRDYSASIRANEIQGYYGYVGGVTKDMVDAYLCTNGEPPATSQGINPQYEGDGSIEDVFENRDPRMRQTILHPDDAVKYEYYAAGGDRSYPRLPGMEGGRIQETGYHPIKFFNYDDTGGAYGDGESPAIIMRYAEVLLNYAEAKAELGTITQNDLDISINQLRDRVNMPHLVLGNVPDDPRSDLPPIIKEIRRERRVELFGEGFRYKDLLRWKQGKQLAEETAGLGLRWDDAARQRYAAAAEEDFLKSRVVEDPITGQQKEYVDVYKGTDWADPVFDESKHYLWPLPLSSLSQNDNLEQNPNW